MHRCPCLQANIGDQNSSMKKNLHYFPELLFAQYNCDGWITATQVKVVKRFTE